MAVPQADRVGVAGVGTAQKQQSEIAQAILGDAVVLVDDLVAVKRQRVHQHVHHPVVRDGTWVAVATGMGRSRSASYSIGSAPVCSTNVRYGSLLERTPRPSITKNVELLRTSAL